MSCGRGLTFVAALAECVPDTFLLSPLYVSAFSTRRACTGGTFSTQQQLERLRFCDVIEDSLTIEVDDTEDFSALSGIEAITGTARTNASPTLDVLQGRLRFDAAP